MDPPPPATLTEAASDVAQVEGPTLTRRNSSSQQSDGSQTAADIIRDQMQLEADAREALPYSINSCTKDLGPLRQSVFSCLTCNPPPANVSDPYNGAGICYACSVQCHGEHQLVEIFNKRNFTCDCGTTRLPMTSPCTLRLNPATNTRGMHSEEPNANNEYNQNFRNRFCACECDYDPFQQKGTMFQCLGLGTHNTGGCGEDWYHPGCTMGLGLDWYDKSEGKKAQKSLATEDRALEPISEDTEVPGSNGENAPANETEEADEDEDQPNPPGFPNDEDFDTFLCYKCVEAYAWIKRYAGTPGFLPPLHRKDSDTVEQALVPVQQNLVDMLLENAVDATQKKRKAEDDDTEDSQETKRPKTEPSAIDGIQNLPLAEIKPQDSVSVVEEPLLEETPGEQATSSTCIYESLPPAPTGIFSIFCTESFRDRFCRCEKCYPHLATHTQLLEEEEIYEPPVSEDSDHGGSTHGSGSLYERGESALKNVDRVRAIEGVMAYNKLKNDLQPFFQKFAESGKAIGAEDIKEYFAKLRGDDEAIKEAGESAKTDHRQEQSGY